MSLLAEAKSLALELMAHHHAVEGVGPDVYSNEPRSHPMADAIFLQAISVAFEGNIVSESTANAWIAGAVERLMRSRLHFAGGAGWGLGFAFRDAAADEPYVVTTAIVARSMRMLQESNISLPGGSAHTIEFVHGQAIDALAEWFRIGSVGGGQRGAIPYYSPKSEVRILNSAALAIVELQLWPNVYRESEGETWSHYNDLLDRSFIRRIGWPYSDESEVVDLLHQAFMINSRQLRGINVEDALIDTSLLFGTPFGYIDTARIIRSSEIDSQIMSRLFERNGIWLMRSAKSARTWSLGAWLEVLANHHVEYDDWRERWRSTAFDVLSLLVHKLLDSSNVESKQPRQYTFGALGILTLVARERRAVVRNSLEATNEEGRS